MNNQVNSPPPVDTPRKSYSFWKRVPVSLLGIVIALLPAPYFLSHAREIGAKVNSDPMTVGLWAAGFSLIGSYVCLRALISERWVALAFWPLLALGFFAVNCAIGIFVGCAAGLAHM